MSTPERVQRWDAENRDRTNARKLAYKDRQKARREAVASAAQTQETNIR